MQSIADADGPGMLITGRTCSSAFVLCSHIEQRFSWKAGYADVTNSAEVLSES